MTTMAIVTMNLQLLLLLHLLLLLSFPVMLQASIIKGVSFASINSSWIGNPGRALAYSDGVYIPVFINTTNPPPNYPLIGCGFYSPSTLDSYYFVVTIMAWRPLVLWTANRDNPVRANSTLELTSDGDLVLRDVDGALAWSTNTSHKSVSAINLDLNGNLFLLDAKRSIIWQSFDHPTDTWLPGQVLIVGQRLIARVSSSNLTSGPYYVSVVNNGLHAYFKPDELNLPEILYGVVVDNGTKTIPIWIGSLNISRDESTPRFSMIYAALRKEAFQYMRLNSDGRLLVYQWDIQDKMELGARDVLGTVGGLDYCDYPSICGTYGICSNNGTFKEQYCSCPIGSHEDLSYFEPLPTMQNKVGPRGCARTTQLSCQHPQLHQFLQLNDVSSINFVTVLRNIDVESCKQACLNNCSCQAALFRYDRSHLIGNCSLPSKIFSLKTNRHNNSGYNFTTFLKVQVSPAPSSPPPPTIANNPSHIPPKEGNRSRTIVLVSSLGALFVMLLILSTCVLILRNRKGVKGTDDDHENQEEEGYLYQVSEMPRRFSYEELRIATENFSRRLGGGGFGSVFEGVLDNDTKVAVKRLDQLGQGRKEFLAEVKTIGSIHHLHLVRLVGFCAEKTHRLLVYEYMCNGSLEKWIFNGNAESTTLDWQTRQKIILDIAKGIEYLHEECQKRIAHLDIKPQNILLDGKFNAKVSDFGLARLIDREQSQVITTMRGTRGYLAPEWLLNGRITEKVDVYSFGVVVLEMMCGRRNLDYTYPEEDNCLLPEVKKKAEENQLFEIVDGHLQQYMEEAIKMMKIAIWCLQGDVRRRPSMSMVVKVLEGVMEMDPISDYSFLNLIPTEASRAVNSGGSAPLLESVLSGPR